MCNFAIESDQWHQLRRTRRTLLTPRRRQSPHSCSRFRRTSDRTLAEARTRLFLGNHQMAICPSLREMARERKKRRRDRQSSSANRAPRLRESAPPRDPVASGRPPRCLATAWGCAAAVVSVALIAGLGEAGPLLSEARRSPAPAGRRGKGADDYHSLFSAFGGCLDLRKQ